MNATPSAAAHASPPIAETSVHIENVAIISVPAARQIAHPELAHHLLCYVVNGTVRFWENGEDRVLRKGDIVLARPGNAYKMESGDGSPYAMLSVAFDMNGHLPSAPNAAHRTYLGNFYNHPVEKQLYELLKTFRKKDLLHSLLCKYLFVKILSDLVGKPDETPDALPPQKTAAKMLLIRNYLMDHYNEDIKIKDLESISGLSKNYLISQFKKYFGMQPMKYLIWLRIEKAKELALNTDLSFSEIARIVGYSDIHTFGKIFKRKTGVSLSQFCSMINPD
ncbi:MAG TPA: AraC family transcriptional regulator [Paenibacillaceae bacterium]